MTYKTIPYGIANYRDVRAKNGYYVDKTMYIPQIEETGKYLFFIRPRRFGKSLWLSTLEHYYDVATTDEFDTLFAGTYIHDHPTPEKNRYLILPFNFSRVNPELGKLEEAFDDYLHSTLVAFVKKYHHCFDADFFPTFERTKQACQQLQWTLDYVGAQGYQTYILIDEYDNFTNTIMATNGQLAYREITHGAGFYRFFFNTLKGAAGTSNSGVARLFITGVSPVTMDDVTSGFNIGIHISLNPRFNELLGFTEQDVREMLTHYNIPSDAVLPAMHKWYNNYRFSRHATTYLFNTDMVWYGITQYLDLKMLPEDMVDQNIKIDYGKLRHLLVLNQQLNGNFNYLRHILETHRTHHAQVVVSFPMEYLTEPENFVSLLFYFGFLSFASDDSLVIPNETVKQLLYNFLRRGYQDVGIFKTDIWHLIGLLKDMLYDGQWQPMFAFLAQEIDKQTSIRDYLQGEKVIQTFLLAYLNVSNYFMTRTEHEMGKGFVDIYMEPQSVLSGRVPYGYLIELKYVTRSEWSEVVGQEKLAEAQEQLARYAQDLHILAIQDRVQLKQVALVYAGWELKLMAEG